MVRSPRRSQACTACVALLAWTIVTWQVDAQWPENPPPAGSSYWWTLSEDISPDELREALQNVEAHRQRLWTAVMEEIYKPVPAEEWPNLRIFVDGSLTPELIPMAEAFDAFAARWEYRRDWDRLVVDHLTAWGITPKAIAEITALAADHRKREEEIMAEIRPGQTAVLELLRQLEQQPGGGVWRQRINDGDWEGFALATGRSRQQIQGLARDWKRSPIRESSTVSMTKLRNALSASDWQRFRNYLREEVAVKMRVLDFENPGKGGAS